jgi:hypothetical protein
LTASLTRSRTRTHTHTHIHTHTHTHTYIHTYTHTHTHTHTHTQSAPKDPNRYIEICHEEQEVGRLHEGMYMIDRRRVVDYGVLRCLAGTALAGRRLGMY